MPSADMSVLDDMIANATPIKTSVGRLQGAAASAAGRENMVTDLACYHHLYRPASKAEPNIFGGLTVLGRFRTMAGEGIRTSGQHNSEGFYLVRVTAGDDEGTTLAVGAGEFNRYIAGDGTPTASVNRPLSKNFDDVRRMDGWGEKLAKLGISQVRTG